MLFKLVTAVTVSQFCWHMYSSMASYKNNPGVPAGSRMSNHSPYGSISRYSMENGLTVSTL